MKRTQQIKENLKISCYYQQDGANAREAIKQSFQSFVKNGLIKSCA